MLQLKSFGVLFPDDQLLTKHEQINLEYDPPSTFSQSTDVPHPVGMFENKFHAASDESSAEQPCTSTAGDDLPDTFDQMSHNQVTDSDKPYTFTPAQLKLENQEPDFKYDINEEENVMHVIENKYNILGTMSEQVSDVANAVSCPDEKGEMLPVISLKQEDTDETPYTCTVCGKSFTSSSSLTAHSHIHTGERRYKCTVCGKSFTRNNALTVHSYIHTGERPYKCTVCGKSFTRFSHLSAHSLIHTGESPYKCTVCGKSFTWKNNLTAHSLIHTGEKPYKCTVCGKSFTRNNTLTAHSHIHTGERPYKCTVCGKSFTRNFTLTAHSKTHL